MNRRPVWLVIGAALLLSACAVGGRNVGAPVVYDFGMLPAPGAAGGGRLSSLDVRSPPWFDALGIDYRLAYDDPLRQREYADSRWVANPAFLLAQRLRLALGVPTAANGAGCLLRVDVQEFSQVFDSPHASHAVVQADVALFDGRRRLAQRTLRIERPAVTPDARGGVVALVASADALGAELERWFGALRKQPEGATACLEPSGRDRLPK